MSETITGRISYIQKVVSREHNGKTYNSQKVLIEIEGYQGRIKTIPLDIQQAVQDRIDEYKVGDTVTAHYELNGNAYTNKQGEQDAFLSVRVWKLEKNGQQSNYQAPQPAPSYVTGVPDAGTDPNDLPF